MNVPARAPVITTATDLPAQPGERPAFAAAVLSCLGTAALAGLSALCVVSGTSFCSAVALAETAPLVNSLDALALGLAHSFDKPAMP